MKKFDYTFKALWTVCSISLIWDTDQWHIDTINYCYKYVCAFENEFSRFKPTSSLSLLNDSKKMEVSDRFLNLLDKSRVIFQETQGYFNPLINMNIIGYSHNFTDKNFEIISAKENLDFLAIKNYGNVIELQPDMNLDFWSIAKGYLADLVWEILKKRWFQNFMANMWGDIIVGGVNHLGKKWKIWVSSPFDGQEVIADIEISNKSISTSGTYLRNWDINGKKFHHIRTPFSQNQCSDIVSVSIVDFFWYKTDAYATALLAMWMEKAKEFCKKYSIEALLVDAEWEIFSTIKA